MSDTPKYYAVLTEAGAALEARALAEGRGVVLTHIVIGDANLEEVTPDPAVTELVHEVHRRPIDAKSLDEDDPKITLLHAVIPASEGGFWIRELGVIGRLEDAEGDECNPGVLYAYANHAPYYKMLPQDGQTVTHELTVPIVQASNARLIIQVSDEGYATRRQFQDLNERVGALEGELSGDTDGENSGIVARVDRLEEPFTPPTEEEPGKNGLVPAPAVMSEEQAQNSYLGADGNWHRIKRVSYGSYIDIFTFSYDNAIHSDQRSPEYKVPDDGFIWVSIQSNMTKGGLAYTYAHLEILPADEGIFHATAGHWIRREFLIGDLFISYDVVPVKKGDSIRVGISSTNNVADLLSTARFIPLA